jgi:predicted GNAT family N-acyltransferase
MKKKISLKTADTFDDLIKVLIVRGIVFIEEQRVAYEEEIDAYEIDSVHILGEIAGEPAAAGRIRFLEGYAKLERIAVRRSFRGNGYAHELVVFMLGVARSKGFQKFKMHAQTYLRRFYEQYGFIVKGDVFKEAGIDHYLMVLEG